MPAPLFMNNGYDAVILVPSGQSCINGAVDADSRALADEGIRLFREKRACYLVLDHLLPSYVKECGILETNLLRENHASDPVVKAFYIRKNFLEPHNLQRNMVVAGAYQHERIRAIYGKICGRDYGADFVFVKSSSDNDAGMQAYEQRMLEAFLAEWKGVKDGDVKGIGKMLKQRLV